MVALTWFLSHLIFAEFVLSVMAETLPFSIANILRSDFPHPSRISKVPSHVHVTPSREKRKALFFTRRCQSFQRLPHCCCATRATGGKSLQTLRAVEKDVSENLGYVQGQEQNRLTGTMKEGNFISLVLCMH